MTRAHLSLRITTDHEDKDTPVHHYLKLYWDADEGSYIWRVDGERGDECETLPRPRSVAQAKKDARSAYPFHSPFQPWASWL